ncbi:hypothetical protein BDQ17DRAFT_1393366 [Cyathus striatus]|nr:hypothetical protein BDQ17DRAFT_1393366 [Cyathus striatus]
MAFRNAKYTHIEKLYAVDKSRGGESASCLGASHQSEERYDAPKCHPDTREAVINDIMSWVNAKDPEKRIMWLNGPAGAGKSAIIQTVAEQCYREKKLVSSFFFSRTATGSGQDDGTKLVPTIAYQLGNLLQSAKELIINEIEENEALLSHTMEIQMEKLVLKPLATLYLPMLFFNMESNTSHLPHLVIIDGLDECNRSEMQSRIVKMITGVASKSGIYLSFLIASRPELVIRRAFNDEAIGQLCIPLILDNKYNPDKDIETYLRSEFSVVKRTHGTLSSDISDMPNWPSESDLKILVQRSSRQFIYASTVIKYITND